VAFSVFAALAGRLPAQTLNNGSLSGKYHFVHLLVTASGGVATDARNLSGSMTFDGNGGYTFTGRLGAGAGAPGNSSGSGTYSVNSSGDVTLTNPINNTLQVTSRLAEGAVAVLGASTEAASNTNDLFVAIKAPTGNVTNAALNGAYTGASLQLPNGSSAGIRSALVSLTANGGGQFTRAAVTGHAADQNAGRNSTQEAAGSTYTLNADGTGTAAFASGASLFSGNRDIFVSQDGNYLLGASNANGGRDIFLAAKNFSTAANNAALDGRYWIAELIIYDGSFSAASGALRAFGNGRASLAQRLHQDTTPIDFTTVNLYSVNADSTGALGPFLETGALNMGLGVSVNVDGAPRPNAVVSAQVGPVNTTTPEYGVSFLIRAPRFTGSGVFLDPTGVVSNASRAPTPNPIAPLQIVELYGSNLAPRNGQPTALPLPTVLEGVSVAVNGQLAPLFFVSSGQVNIQVPSDVSGVQATIQVNNNGNRSNEVIIPVARTSPGIYAYSDTQSANRAIITHADGQLVTPQNPARPEEVVIIYLTGLGALNPPVASGAANPSNPLPRAADSQIQILFGGEAATRVDYIGGAPFFAGLNQINVTVPATAPIGPNIPVAIVTSNAYTDLPDISINF
jgi:uncharacterized protein (TIGR03437 family)